MSHDIFAGMKRLQEEIAAEKGGVQAHLTTFPTGSAMLDVCREGRGFVMAYTPAQGFGVDELQPDDGFLSGYQFVYEDFAPAAKKLRDMTIDHVSNGSSSATLSLVVLQCANIQVAKDFYSLLGLSFIEEQHGMGPRHFSAAVGSLVLELYPCQGNSPSAPLRIGFRVPALDETLALLRKRGSHILREPKDSPWGRRAVVEDPDGNRIELG